MWQESIWKMRAGGTVRQHRYMGHPGKKAGKELQGLKV
jgi:hypothetical protein